MKKVLVILVVMVLTTFVGAEVKMAFSFGAGVYDGGTEFNFNTSAPFRDETITWDERADGIGTVFSPVVGVGFYPIPELEIYGSLTFYKGESATAYLSQIPDIWFYNRPHSVSTTRDNEVSGSAISFGVAYHVTMGATVGVYLGLGMTSNTVNIEVLHDVDITDRLWLFGEEITINDITVRKQKFNAIAPHMKGGIDIYVSPIVCVYIESLYSRPKNVAGTHDMGQELSNIAWRGTDSFKVGVGGFSASVGIRIFVR